MVIYFRNAIFLAVLAVFIPAFSSFAIDFDQDGYDDFILIDINSKNRLEWYAVDLNDPARRPLGQFGKAGDHLAVGNWSGNNTSSMALIQKKSNGDLEWDINLSGVQRSLTFGRSADMAISGLDSDNNGAIDPATVSRVNKSLVWRIMLNPGLTASPAVQEVVFGTAKDLPFYANIDGTGDKLAVARVNKKKVLTIRHRDAAGGRVKTIRINNYKSVLSRILPVALPNGKDALFAVSKKGKKYAIAIISGGKKVKGFNVSGDEIVVGKYLGDGNEVVVVRNNASTGTFITGKGKKSTISLDLNGILVDDVNINSFESSGSPGGTPPPSNNQPPGSGKGKNPSCSGVMNSTEHLLYKPVSDTSGNAVIVFDSKYSKEFRSVKIQLKDGSFADAWWKGLALWGNPDPGGPRQHWRTNVRANQIKDGALIIVDDTNQECRFVLPGSANRRWE